MIEVFIVSIKYAIIFLMAIYTYESFRAIKNVKN